MQSVIRNILGEVTINLTRHGVAKTDSGRFAVGSVAVGLPANQCEEFDTLEDAFNHWYKTMPKRTMTVVHHNGSEGASGRLASLNFICVK